MQTAFVAFGLGVASSLVVKHLQRQSKLSNPSTYQTVPEETATPTNGVDRRSHAGPVPNGHSKELCYGAVDTTPQDQPQLPHEQQGEDLSSPTLLLPRVAKSSPQPDWTPGQPQPHPYGSNPRLHVDPDTVDKPSIYALGISAVTPRPIALISSQGADGSKNLAPYSYFNVMQHNPPLVVVGLARSAVRNSGLKDSFRNIMETGECVISIISEWFIESANMTCGDFPPDVDEKALVGLTPLPSIKVKPSGVAESVCNMECRLVHTYETNDKVTGVPSGCIAVLEVVMYQLVEEATMKTPTGKLVMDPLKMLPVSRLGGLTYSRLGGLFDLGRPVLDAAPIKTQA